MLRLLFFLFILRSFENLNWFSFIKFIVGRVNLDRFFIVLLYRCKGLNIIVFIIDFVVVLNMFLESVMIFIGE